MRAGGKILRLAPALAALVGCRAIDDLGGRQFDLSPNDGGAAGTGGTASCAPAGDVCASTPPPGWTGPIAFYEGASGTVPACSGAYPIRVAQGNTNLDARPATCGACTCSTPTASCGSSTLAIDAKSNCHAAAGEPLLLGSGACTPLGSGSGSSNYFEQTSPSATLSACTPSTGTSTVPATSWTTAGVACGLSGDATPCGDAGVCAPPPAEPFGAQWCIFQKGAQSCPLEFNQKHVWEDVATDDRGCTPCTCGSASRVTCATRTAIYGDAQCQSEVGSLADDGTCGGAWTAAAAIATTTLSGTPSCPAGGGAPTGKATTTTVLTVCCPG